MHLLTRGTYALRSPAIALQFSVRAKGLMAVVKRMVRPLVVAGAGAALDCAANAVHTAIPSPAAIPRKVVQSASLD